MRPAAACDVLLVDDNEGFVRLVREVARQAGCRLHHAACVADASALLAKRKSFDLLLVDIMLPDGNGLDLIEDIDIANQGHIAIVTGMPSVETAVRVLNTPVVDYLIKPVTAAKLQQLMLDAHSRGLVQARLEQPVGGMIGASAQMQALFEQIRQIGPHDASVLIYGESGTGKELVAHALADQSQRSGRFVAVNCGAIPHDLLGSQLFGHERGSFTGALQSHAGFFEQAEGGTLFLDEVTEMSPQLQVYLLRVLESNTLTRLGGTRELTVDVRVIAATNRDPLAAVKAGVLREDVYYRLIEFPLYLHPLRERPDDIPLLAQHFLDRLNAKYDTEKAFRAAAMERMSKAAWQGNVRELRHAVQRNYILAGDGELVDYRPAAAPTDGPADPGSVRFSVGMTFDEIEREMLLKTLARCDYNKSRAAEILGITAKTIYNRLQRYRAEGLIDDDGRWLHLADDADDSTG